MKFPSEIILTQECKDWYVSLSPKQKEYVKGEAFETMCGVEFELMGLLFSEEQLIQILYDKLTEQTYGE